MEQKILNTKNRFLDKHFILKWILIPILLFCFWVLASFINLTNNLGLTILTYSHSQKEIVSKNYSELLAGQKITGEFKARDDNLGIVSVRFNTYFRINEDVVIFRIKQRDEKDWYYVYDYTTPQFQPNQYFTFGFPIISNSTGKIYDFEIESTKGEPDNAVALSSIEPTFETKYQYSKELILHNLRYAEVFLVHKVANSFSDFNFLLAFIIYSMPFMVYLIWLFFFGKYLSDKYYLVIVPIISMFLGSFVNTVQSDTAVIGFTLLWFFLALVYKFKSTLTLIISLLFIIASSIIYYTPLEELSKNFTVWGFMLLTVGVFQEIIELKWENRNLISFTDLKNINFSKGSKFGRRK